MCCEYHNSPVLDLASHCHESLLHIRGILGTGLKEWDANLVSKSLYAKSAIAKAQEMRQELSVLHMKTCAASNTVHLTPCPMPMPRVETGTKYAE